jgi:hypothetical protein
VATTPFCITKLDLPSARIETQWAVPQTSGPSCIGQWRTACRLAPYIHASQISTFTKSTVFGHRTEGGSVMALISYYTATDLEPGAGCEINPLAPSPPGGGVRKSRPEGLTRLRNVSLGPSTGVTCSAQYFYYKVIVALVLRAGLSRWIFETFHSCHALVGKETYQAGSNCESFRYRNLHRREPLGPGPPPDFDERPSAADVSKVHPP